MESVRPAQRPLAGAGDPVVLYAPTWRGHVSETALSSLASGEQIVTALLAHGATVIFRPHPFSEDFPADAAVATRIRALLAADAAGTGRQHRWGAAAESGPIIEVMNDADALVSDVSSVVSDFLFSAKPYAMIATTDALEQFVHDYPIARAAYLVDPGLRGLDAALGSMLGADPLAGRRLELRADYLGPAAAGPAAAYAATFTDAVIDVLDSPAGPAELSAETDDGTSRVSRDTVRRHALVLLRTLGALLGSTLALAAALTGSVPGSGAGSGAEPGAASNGASDGASALLALGVAGGVVTVVIGLSALLPQLRGSGRSRGGLGPDRPVDRIGVIAVARTALVLSCAATLARHLGGSGPVTPVTLSMLIMTAIVLAAVAAEEAALRLLSADGVIASGLDRLRIRAVPAGRQLGAPLAGTIGLAFLGLLAAAPLTLPGLVLLAVLAVPAGLAAASAGAIGVPAGRGCRDRRAAAAGGAE